MNRCLDYWCALSSRRRAAVWLLVTLSLLLTGGWIIARPVGNALEQQRARLIAQRQTMRDEWQHARQRQSLLHAQAERAPAKAFSPLDFQHAQARLTRWQPGNGGGEMALDVQWARVPVIFDQLAERNMRVSAFSLTPEEGALRFTLQLEGGDES